MTRKHAQASTGHAKIPLQLPFLNEHERQAVFEAITEGHIAGNGPVCKAVEEEIAATFGARHVFLTTSCTHALELAALSLDLGPGDEVIMPSFTFPSTANAFMLRRAELVFADIQPETFDLDPDDVRKRITPRTRAIVVVHYAGMPCAMDEFLKIADEHHLAIIEDAAQAVDTLWRDRYMGTVGDIGCYSFHSTKNVTCGEGGAFLTNSDKIADRAEIIREKGTNRRAFLRGEVDRYSWVAPGSSYVLSDLLAAVLQAQFRKRPTIKSLRGKIWNRYQEVLQPLKAKHGLTLPAIPANTDPNYHLYAFLVDSNKRRNRVLDLLHEDGIGATFHYVPLHSAAGFTSTGKASPNLPVTDAVSERLIRLPLYPGLAANDVERVLASLVHALDNA